MLLLLFDQLLGQLCKILIHIKRMEQTVGVIIICIVILKCRMLVLFL